MYVWMYLVHKYIRMCSIEYRVLYIFLTVVHYKSVVFVMLFVTMGCNNGLGTMSLPAYL